MLRTPCSGKQSFEAFLLAFGLQRLRALRKAVEYRHASTPEHICLIAGHLSPKSHELYESSYLTGLWLRLTATVRDAKSKSQPPEPRPRPEMVVGSS